MKQELRWCLGFAKQDKPWRQLWAGWIRAGSWWCQIVSVVIPVAASCSRPRLRLCSNLRFLAFWMGGMAVWMVVAGNPLAWAETIQEKDALIVTKEITGQLSVVTPRFVAVEYNQDARKGIAYEMAFSMDGDVRVSGAKRDLQELQAGDTVAVTYEEKTWMDDSGQERIKRQVKGIQFIRSAEQGLRSGS